MTEQQASMLIEAVRKTAEQVNWVAIFLMAATVPLWWGAWVIQYEIMKLRHAVERMKR